jgi:pimeloyl-ACP methyl ester carboxylesterase
MPTVPPVECFRVEHDGGSIYFQVSGDGKPVILIHGLAGSTRWWASTRELLATHFHVYTIDLISFGATSSRHPFVLDEAARFLAEWLERVGEKHASVVGHSMGGLIAADLAGTFPERVDHLVLVSPATLPPTYSYPRALLGLIRTVPRISPRFLPILIADSVRAGPRVLWTATRQVLAADFQSRLRLVRAPTLLIWGERDRLVPVSVGRQLLHDLPRFPYPGVEFRERRKTGVEMHEGGELEGLMSGGLTGCRGGRG